MTIFQPFDRFVCLSPPCHTLRSNLMSCFRYTHNFWLFLKKITNRPSPRVAALWEPFARIPDASSEGRETLQAGRAISFPTAGPLEPGFSNQRGEAWERITEKNRAWTKLAWRREKVQPNDHADWKYALYSKVAFTVSNLVMTDRDRGGIGCAH